MLVVKASALVSTWDYLNTSEVDPWELTVQEEVQEKSEVEVGSSSFNG
jgi:hypothetical protein